MMPSYPLWMSLCCASLVSADVWGSSATVRVDPSQELFPVDPRFISFNLDAGVAQNSQFDFLDPLFIDRLKALAPAIFRVGGGSQICWQYDFPGVDLNKDCPLTTPYCDKKVHYKLEPQRWDQLLKLAKETGVSLTLGLNSLCGRTKEHHSYNAAMVIALMNYTASAGGGLDLYELGNEPRASKYGFKLSGKQLAEDLVSLASEVEKVYSAHGLPAPQPMGPDQDQGNDCDPRGDKPHCPDPSKDWVFQDSADFVKDAASVLKGVTWHYYSMNGDDPTLKSRLLTPAMLDQVVNRSAKYHAAVASAGLPVQYSMIGEFASAAFGGGDALWSADQLGLLASTGVGVVMRQQIIEGNYGLLNNDTGLCLPNPTYYLSFLFKQLLSGGKMVKVSGGNYPDTLRAYAACTSDSKVLVLLDNVDSQPISVTIDGASCSRMEVYSLTSTSLYGDETMLNGKVLKPLPNGMLPPLPPSNNVPCGSVDMPAYSILFVTLTGSSC